MKFSSKTAITFLLTALLFFTFSLSSQPINAQSQRQGISQHMFESVVEKMNKLLDEVLYYEMVDLFYDTVGKYELSAEQKELLFELQHECRKKYDEYMNLSRTMYSLDGRTISVKVSEVENYKNVGWYEKPMQTVYALDGRTLVIPQLEADAYVAVGWYTSPVQTVYANDGRTLVIPKSEIEAYVNVGWFTTPDITMYSADGRTLQVLRPEIEAHKNVGWYEFKDYIFIKADRDVIEYDHATAVHNLEAHLNDKTIISDADLTANILVKILELTEQWYKSSGAPLAVIDWRRSENSIGIPEITIRFRNISDKNIIALETRFTCYDYYGKVTTDFPSLYNGSFKGYAENENIKPHEEVGFTWTLYNNERTAKISWPQLLKVAFSDGTSWYR